MISAVVGMRLNGERYINMVIYISGPITGEKDYMERFMNAETRINKVTYGDVIINPAYILSALPDGTSHDIYMSVTSVYLPPSLGFGPKWGSIARVVTPSWSVIIGMIIVKCLR